MTPTSENFITADFERYIRYAYMLDRSPAESCYFEGFLCGMLSVLKDISLDDPKAEKLVERLTAELNRARCAEACRLETR